MPSITHEALILLFRNRPELAPELLHDALGVELPAYSEVRVEAADFSDVVPAEYHADLVVLLVDNTPVLAIVVEVQLQRDDRKCFTWPVYLAGLRARLECEACVLVVTPSETIADWARTPIKLGPGSSVVPFVIGPNAVPVVCDPKTAKRDPELVVLSAMAHGKREVGLEIAAAALEACRGLDDERALLYLDLVGTSLSNSARTAFEDLMASGNYELQTEFVKRLRAAVRDAGHAEGRAAGHAEGRAEGRALGEATAVIAFLEARGIGVSDEQKARLFACTDLEVLDRWIRKAVVAMSAEDLFAD